jgi:hypothetical protein
MGNQVSCRQRSGRWLAGRRRSPGAVSSPRSRTSSDRQWLAPTGRLESSLRASSAFTSPARLINHSAKRRSHRSFSQGGSRTSGWLELLLIPPSRLVPFGGQPLDFTTRARGRCGWCRRIEPGSGDRIDLRQSNQFSTAGLPTPAHFDHWGLGDPSSGVLGLPPTRSAIGHLRVAIWP